MSWSSWTAPVPADAFATAVDAADVHGLSDPPAEQAPQVAAAKRAAKALVASGVLGTAGRFAAHLSGHANAGHRPEPGWSGDTLYISVTVEPDAPAAPAEAPDALAALEVEADPLPENALPGDVAGHARTRHAHAKAD